MKHHLLLGLCAILTLYSSAVAQEPSDATLIPMDQLTEEQACNFFVGEGLRPIIQISAGTLLPIQFFLEGDWIGLHQEDEKECFLEVKKEFFVRAHKDHFHFSINLEDWYPLHNFITGGIQMDVAFDSGYPALRLGGDIQIKTHPPKPDQN